MPSEMLDDKSQHCIPFILERLQAHRHKAEADGEEHTPFFIGLNGVQGAGKTTLVSALCQTLSSSPHNLPTVILSIDDLYLPHSKQLSLAKYNPGNPLVQHRGQPSTHDVALGTHLFASLMDRQRNIKIPSYDKSAFSGEGERKPESEWEAVNKSGEWPIEVVIFEGWCVGFKALDDSELVRKWSEAKKQYETEGSKYPGQLGKLKLEDVMFVNEALGAYDAMTDNLNAFIHIDAEDTQYVYDWRLQQEAALREQRGAGMTDAQVINFVNGYYPAYELYTDVLRRVIYGEEEGTRLRLMVGKDRKVKHVYKL